MRTTLFLSGLFAVSLFGTVALAEKPHADKPVREPKAVQVLRSHGDQVDKAARAHDKASQKASQATNQAKANQRNPLDRSGSRVNCSDTGADCGKGARANDPASGAAGTAGGVHRPAQWPAFMDKILGSDRMACNEADECSMGHAAVNRAWSRAAGNNAGASSAAVPLAQQRQVPRELNQASQQRTSCNEAEECSYSSKGAKKEWAYSAVKAGTWQPADKNADKNADKAAAVKAAKEKK